MRKMATIRVINKLEPIPGADAILKATVDGWEVVVKKDDNHFVGETVVYCEVDSLMPADNPNFGFLKDRHYRIRTVRLRKQISQGICFPMSILPDGVYAPGDDVSEILGVVKYEPPVNAQLAGQVRGNFPSFIPKTDQERCQNHPRLIEDEWAGKILYVTEKLDGSSITIYLNEDTFGICSRNLDLKINEGNENNTYIKTAKEFEIEDKLQRLRDDMKFNLAIQGEICGPGIQKNPLQLSKVNIFFYNMWNIDKQCYVDINDFIAPMAYERLALVPMVMSTFTLRHTVKDLVELASGPSVLNPKVKREGLVFRSITEEYIDRFGWLSFKAISPEYLLKHGE